MHRWLTPLIFRDGRSLPCRIIPGPMEGITEGSYISVMSSCGFVSSWFTPFIRISSGVPRNSKIEYKLQQFKNSGLPIIAQVMGTNSRLLAEAARRLHQHGATCVDLNCACPSATVLGSRSGGWTLTEPDWIYNTLLEMKKACGNCGVSVKIRCGYYKDDEMEDIASAISAAAPDMVTCHFRTVKELYRPVPDGVYRLRRMRELLPNTPLIGSGDLFTVEDARRMYEIADVDGVAPARGMLKNPALLREIKSDCEGKTPMAALTDEEKINFLNQVGELSGHRRKEQGFILKIAKVMYGENSEEFARLLSSITNC